MLRRTHAFAMGCGAFQPTALALAAKARGKGSGSGASSSSQAGGSSSSSAAKSGATAGTSPRIEVESDGNRLRIGVLHPHSEGTWKVDDSRCSPDIYASRDLPYQFEAFTIRKNTAFRQLRKITSEGKCDAYWNLCDGARDEVRTGEDTVRVLESLNVPFTGADSQVFEPSKIEMKMLLAAAGIRTPNFAVLDRQDLADVQSACSHLRFPVIVKHISGYGSIGINADSKCADMSSLVKRVKKFVLQYDVALVEEFISGEEGTVFVCGDPKSPTGVHVFPPLMIPVPGGDGEFLHFGNKWKNDFLETTKVKTYVRPNEPRYEKIAAMAANAFIHIMQRVGYGRCDFRIDSITKEPYFLEINPNCGIFLPAHKSGKPSDDEGDYADFMIREDKEWGHDRFIRNSIDLAIKQQRARTPWWCHSYSTSAAAFITKATKAVPMLTRVFGDSVRPIPVVARTLFDATVKTHPDEVKVGCAIFRGDALQSCVVIQHSCEPNCGLVHTNTVELASTRPIAKGETLTIDYASVRDPAMPDFRCSCGAPSCRGIIRAETYKVRSREAARKKMMSGSAGGGGGGGGGSAAGAGGGNGNAPVSKPVREPRSAPRLSSAARSSVPAVDTPAPAVSAASAVENKSAALVVPRRKRTFKKRRLAAAAAQSAAAAAPSPAVAPAAPTAGAAAAPAAASEASRDATQEAVAAPAAVPTSSAESAP